MGRSHCNNDVSGTILLEQWCQRNYSTNCTSQDTLVRFLRGYVRTWSHTLNNVWFQVNDFCKGDASIKWSWTSAYTHLLYKWADFSKSVPTHLKSILVLGGSVFQNRNTCNEVKNGFVELEIFYGLGILRWLWCHFCDDLWFLWCLAI